jgi:diguanylate cyclase
LETGEPLAVILMDIDHFKTFNDHFGHEMGDEVLKLVARHLIDHVKGRDLPARFGGEEFAVILPETALKHAYTLADRIRDDLAHRRVTNRATHEVYDRVTVSAGVAEYRLGEPLDGLVRRVDAALYAAKRAGRNCVRSEAALAGGGGLAPADRARSA